MCLTCKIGAYNTILKELLDLKISRSDIFLLFGTFDLLVQFTKLKDLDEFKEKWFNPVRMIGASEDLITRTQTFIVISVGPLLTEDPFAFIFSYTQPRNLENVKKDLLMIPEVLSADTVFGPYDVIYSVKANDREDFERIISKIQKNIPNIGISMITLVTMETMFFF